MLRRINITSAEKGGKEHNTFILVFPFPPLQREKNGFCAIENPNGLFPTRFEALEAHSPRIMQIRRRQCFHALRRSEVAHGIQQAPRQVQEESQTLRREGLQKQR